MKIHYVCSFTDKPFTGNPAGVCIVEPGTSVEWMKNIAQEMNLSETAFIEKKDLTRYGIRWFTPSKTEIDLCGHATLASAHILYETGIVPQSSKITFDSLSGELIVFQNKDQLVMDFPLLHYTEDFNRNHVTETLGFEPKAIVQGEQRYVIELNSVHDVRSFQPDMEKIKMLDRRGLCITAKSDNSKYDFVSRYFVPKAGIPEDPATGSVHCLLANYWRSKLNKSEFKAYQASKRGGELSLQIKDNRILISGHAITEFEIEPRRITLRTS
jgi:PhzF family phenazine biosynthesis protein